MTKLLVSSIKALIFLFRSTIIVLGWVAMRGMSITSGPVTKMEDFIPVFHVISAALCLHYIFLYQQSFASFDVLKREVRKYKQQKVELEASKKGDYDKPVKPTLASIKYSPLDNVEILKADRCVGNFIEQVIPFFIALCGYSMYVSVIGAVKYGWAWIIFRSYYGLVFTSNRIFLSTLPAYFCVWTMIGHTLYETMKY